MNDGHGNGANPSLNGRPYYSADNGFAFAAAGRGVTEALQEHLNVIVRNEELEIERSHSQIQEDIKDLVEDKERLEQRKLDLQNHIKTLTEEHSVKEVKLSELRTELEAPIKPDSPLPDSRVDALKNEIDDNTSALEKKQVARVEIETDLEAPTAAELDTSSVNGTPHISSKQRRSLPESIFAWFATFALFGLVFYLFIFYASAADKSFIGGSGTIEQRLNKIINPHAFFQAWESPINWFIIVFPFVMLMLAILLHPAWKNKAWLAFAFSLLCTIGLDIVIAYKIARNIYEEKINRGIEAKLSLLDMSTVLLLGLAVSILLGIGIHFVLKMWDSAKPVHDKSELEKLKRVERNDRLVQLATLIEEIKHLQNRIGDLKQEKENYERGIEETSKQRLDALIEVHKHPIQVEIARLDAETENLQNQISEFNEQIESIQKEINQCEAEIEALLKRQRERVIDVKKLEAQANEFVSGWCRYVAQSKTQLPADITTQIKDIQHLAHETLETYKASLATV